MTSSSLLPVYDTHCHLEGYWDDAVFDRLLKDAHGIGFLDSVTCPHDATRLNEHLAFCRRFDLSVALGVHPFEWQEAKANLNRLDAALATKPEQLVAIGEIGLDFSERRHREFWPDADMETSKVEQIRLFETQLEIARDNDLPVTVHAFDAMNQMEKSLKKFPTVRGVIHAFNGSVEQAKIFIKLGFKVGFGGTLTYEGSKRIRRVFAELSDTDWVLETDAPWIASAPRRALEPDTPYVKIKSQPADIAWTIEAAAQVRNTTTDTIRRLAYTNTREIFSKLKAADL